MSRKTEEPWYASGEKFIYAPLRCGTPCIATNMNGHIIYRNPDVTDAEVYEVASHAHRSLLGIAANSKHRTSRHLK